MAAARGEHDHPKLFKDHPNMKPFVLFFACFGLFAADPTPSPQPQPKQASLEEANVILQIRNIISVHRERVAQMEKQLLGQETAIRAKHGISQGCQIGDDGRSFVLYNPDNSTRPCPDALPPAVEKKEAKK